jgi:hypothetical protein
MNDPPATTTTTNTDVANINLEEIDKPMVHLLDSYYEGCHPMFAVSITVFQRDGAMPHKRKKRHVVLWWALALRVLVVTPDNPLNHITGRCCGLAGSQQISSLNNPAEILDKPIGKDHHPFAGLQIK